MHILEPLIAHLTKYEKNDLIQYIIRQQAAKELQLAKLMVADVPPSAAEMKEAIYGKSDDKNYKRDAFNGLRKQLSSRICQWIVISRMDSEYARRGKIQGLLIVSSFLLERNAVESARYLLLKAEELALDERQYEWLETIYSQLIQHANEMGLSARELITRRNANYANYTASVDLSFRLALQREQNSLAKQKGTVFSAEIAFAKARKGLQINRTNANDPAYQFQLIRLLRATIVTGKDYTSFERFVEKIHTRFCKHELYRKGDREYETGILFMYAHACYRNRKFKKAFRLCEDMVAKGGERALKELPVYPRYMALRSGIAAFTGNNAEAIRAMELALADGVAHTEIHEWINMQLNLAVYYFQAEHFRKAHKTLVAIRHAYSDLPKRMGTEWCFKVEMIEMIVHYELGNAELSLRIARQLKKEYSAMLGQPIYQRADAFLSLIQAMILDPHLVTTPHFHTQVKSSQLAWPGVKEDVQAITFFCWLKSKMENKPYYAVLLARLHEDLPAEERWEGLG